MTVTEAAACGVPAVVTGVVGHRAAVVDGVTGVLVDTPYELTAAIATPTDDPDLRAFTANADRERAPRLSWDPAAAAHLDITRETVGHGKHATRSRP